MDILSDTIIARSISYFGYKEDRAVEVVDKLQKSNPAVQEVFEKWWKTGELDAEMIVEGYTLQTLVEKKGFNPINACLILDRLIRDPKRMVRSLSRGYDHFLLSPEAEARYEQRKANFKKQKEQENQPLNVKHEEEG